MIVLKEPLWLAIAVALLCALWLTLRRARRRHEFAAAWVDEASGGASAAGNGPAGVRHGPSVWLIIGGAALSLGFSLLLVSLETSRAAVALLVLSATMTALLSLEAYRCRPPAMQSQRARACAAMRLVGLLALLLLLAQPEKQWVETTWERPLLVVALDQSRSMSIRDRDEDEETEDPTRAERYATAVADAAASINRLADFYEVQVRSIGARESDATDWTIAPSAPASPVAAALRDAGQSRSSVGEPPAATLIVSDGGENVVAPHMLEEAAAELAAQGTALIAVGVGPNAASNVSVALYQLDVPPRINARDRLQFPAVGFATGCDGKTLRFEVLWNDEVVDTRNVKVTDAAQWVRTSFEVSPPGMGLHRLSVRVTVPLEAGDEEFSTATIVEVRNEQIRVLVLEGTPSTEFAMLLRALRGDARFDLTIPAFAGPDADGKSAGRPSYVWKDYDVVILGHVAQRRLSRNALSALAEAVRNDGLGLLLAGGRNLFNQANISRSAIAEISPVELTLSRPSDAYRPQFLPARDSRDHPIFLGIAGTNDPSAEAGVDLNDWRALPALPGAAAFGRPKPLAEVLATDEDGAALLATIDVGRGRCMAAAWDGIWPWALQSDRGSHLHRALWRQMVGWLASRRPTAWVLTEMPTYALAALRNGEQRIVVRAGLSGLDRYARIESATTAQAIARLRRLPDPIPASAPATRAADPNRPSTPTTQPVAASSPAGKDEWVVPLRRQGDEWRAELPRDLATQDWLRAGRFAVEFETELSDTRAARRGHPARPEDRYVAETRFDVNAVELEFQEPTAKLGLLRQAADRTREVGGAYYPIDRLSEALTNLAGSDPRRRIERPARYDFAARNAWWLLGLLVTAWGVEWALRKRTGVT